MQPFTQAFERHLPTPASHRLALHLCLCLFAAQISSLTAQGQLDVFEQASDAFEQGKLPEAERALRRALEKNPRDARALGMLGVILDAEKQYDEAQKCYDLALKVDPHS